MPTKVAVCGEKRVCEACLDFLYERNDVELCAVAVSESDWQADLRTWAAAHGIPVLQGNINGHLSELEGMALDFIFSIQSRHLLRPPILALPRRDCINLHFSLLPRYGGCSPVAWITVIATSTGRCRPRWLPKLPSGIVITRWPRATRCASG